MVNRPAILVIGESLIDIVPDGDGPAKRVPGGSPTNVAIGLGRLGHDVTDLTAIGRDPDGDAIRAHLEQSGVRLHHESTAKGSTSTARVVLNSDGDADYEFDVTWGLPAPPIAIDYEIIHTGSIATAIEPGAERLLEILRTRPANARVTVDPNVREHFLDRKQARTRLEPFFQEADLVKLSEDDARYLYPDLTDPDDVIDHVLSLGPSIAVLTLGPRGAILTSQWSRHWVRAASEQVVDTIAAGDSFMVGLIDVLARSEAEWDGSDESLVRLGRRASDIAGITVGRAGADLPWKDELVST